MEKKQQLTPKPFDAIKKTGGPYDIGDMSLEDARDTILKHLNMTLEEAQRTIPQFDALVKTFQKFERIYGEADQAGKEVKWQKVKKVLSGVLFALGVTGTVAAVLSADSTPTQREITFALGAVMATIGGIIFKSAEEKKNTAQTYQEKTTEEKITAIKETLGM